MSRIVQAPGRWDGWLWAITAHRYRILASLAGGQPAFECIRLAQRVPVRIKLDAVPEKVRLRVGTTASVLVKTR
jgi:multidrug resistance efflux pump